jgi:hypothetical protein
MKPTHRQHLEHAWGVFLDEYLENKLGPEGMGILTEDARKMVTDDLREAFYWGARAEWLITHNFKTDETPNGPN